MTWKVEKTCTAEQPISGSEQTEVDKRAGWTLEAPSQPTLMLSNVFVILIASCVYCDQMSEEEHEV